MKKMIILSLLFTFYAAAHVHTMQSIYFALVHHDYSSIMLLMHCCRFCFSHVSINRAPRTFFKKKNRKTNGNNNGKYKFYRWK